MHSETPFGADLGLSVAQIQQLVRTLGFEHREGEAEPTVDLQTYISRLAVASEHSIAQIARTTQERDDMQQVSRWIYKAISSSGKPMHEVFASWDENGDGY